MPAESTRREPAAITEGDERAAAPPSPRTASISTRGRLGLVGAIIGWGFSWGAGWLLGVVVATAGTGFGVELTDIENLWIPALLVGGLLGLMGGALAGLFTALAVRGRARPYDLPSMISVAAGWTIVIYGVMTGYEELSRYPVSFSLDVPLGPLGLPAAIVVAGLLFGTLVGLRLRRQAGAGAGSVAAIGGAWALAALAAAYGLHIIMTT